MLNKKICSKCYKPEFTLYLTKGKSTIWCCRSHKYLKFKDALPPKDCPYALEHLVCQMK